MAGSPGTTGSTWNPDSCWITATTAQMLRAVGRTSSASKAANISIAQPSRFATVVGMRARISARARSGSIGGSRGGAELQPIRNMVPRASSARRGRRGWITECSATDMTVTNPHPLAHQRGLQRVRWQVRLTQFGACTVGVAAFEGEYKSRWGLRSCGNIGWERE